jgi:hypothetical protein
VQVALTVQQTACAVENNKLADKSGSIKWQTGLKKMEKSKRQNKHQKNEGTTG